MDKIAPGVKKLRLGKIGFLLDVFAAPPSHDAIARKRRLRFVSGTRSGLLRNGRLANARLPVIALLTAYYVP